MSIKKLHTDLTTDLLALAGINTVRRYNSQLDNLDLEEAISYPAIYLSYSAEWQDGATGCQRGEVTITVRHVFESYLDDDSGKAFDLGDKVHALLQGYIKDYMDEGGALTRIEYVQDTDHDQLEIFEQIYRAVIIDETANNRSDYLEVANPIDIQVDKQVFKTNHAINTGVEDPVLANSLPCTVFIFNPNVDSLVVLASGKVSLLTSLISGIAFEQTSASKRPELKTSGNYNYLDFVGGQGMRTTTSLNLTAYDMLDFFIVMKAPLNTSKTILELSSNFNSQEDSFNINYDGSSELGISLKGAVGISNTDNVDPPEDKLFIFNPVLDKTKSLDEASIYINGLYDPLQVRAFNSDNSDKFGDRTLYLGSRANTSNFLTGEVYYLATFCKVLNNTERAAITKSLMDYFKIK